MEKAAVLGHLLGFQRVIVFLQPAARKGQDRRPRSKRERANRERRTCSPKLADKFAEECLGLREVPFYQLFWLGGFPY